MIIHRVISRRTLSDCIRCLNQLVHGSSSGKHHLRNVVTKQQCTVLRCLCADLLGGGAPGDEFLYIVRRNDDLMDSGTSGITRSPALLAAALVRLAYLHGFIHAYKAEVSRVGEGDLLLALVAEKLDKSLSDDTNQGGSDHVRRNAHVHQTDDG